MGILLSEGGDEMNDFKKLKDIMNQKTDYNFDPNGSYTGCTEDGSIPVQDADDL